MRVDKQVVWKLIDLLRVDTVDEDGSGSGDCHSSDADGSRDHAVSNKFD
jgi:hypothetical protein